MHIHSYEKNKKQECWFFLTYIFIVRCHIALTENPRWLKVRQVSMLEKCSVCGANRARCMQRPWTEPVLNTIILLKLDSCNWCNRVALLDWLANSPWLKPHKNLWQTPDQQYRWAEGSYQSNWGFPDTSQVQQADRLHAMTTLMQ